MNAARAALSDFKRVCRTDMSRAAYDALNRLEDALAADCVTSEEPQPVAWVTKAALEHWINSDHQPRNYVFLGSGNEMRAPLYTTPVALPGRTSAVELAFDQAVCRHGMVTREMRNRVIDDFLASLRQPDGPQR